MRILLIAALVSVALTSCRSESEGAARRASEFDVVNEGSTSGAASTIGGAPIEADATLASTNVDTTTAFAVLNDPNLATAAPVDPTLVGQLPPPVSVNNSPTTRPSPSPRPSAPPSIKIERVERVDPPPPPSAPAPAEPTEPEMPAEPEEPAEDEPAPEPAPEPPAPPPAGTNPSSR